MEDRMEVKLLGKVLGTASGWDEVDDHCVVFYNLATNTFGQKLLKFWGEDYRDFEVNFVTGEVVIIKSDDNRLAVKLLWRHFED